MCVRAAAIVRFPVLAGAFWPFFWLSFPCSFFSSAGTSPKFSVPQVRLYSSAELRQTTIFLFPSFRFLVGAGLVHAALSIFNRSFLSPPGSAFLRALRTGAQPITIALFREAADLVVILDNDPSLLLSGMFYFFFLSA